LAPYKVIILNLDPKVEEITAAAEDIYKKLQTLGVETLIDDRDERPGSKFKDADLLGIPYRVTVGKRFVKEGLVEVRQRRDGQTEDVPAEAVPDILKSKIDTEVSA
jgi:prolyl-tRNA synthetase